MRKLLLIIGAASLLSACSSVGQMSLTHSRYGNGWKLGMGSGELSKAEEQKAEAFRKEKSEQVEFKRTLNAMNASKKGIAIVTLEDLVFDQKLSVVESEISVPVEANVAPVFNKPVNTFENSKMLNNLEDSKINKTVVKQAVRKITKQENKLADGNTLLLVLLVLLGLSPVAMYLYEGEWTNRVTLNLVLWLLCGLPGIIHALIVILGNK